LLKIELNIKNTRILFEEKCKIGEARGRERGHSDKLSE